MKISRINLLILLIIVVFGGFATFVLTKSQSQSVESNKQKDEEIPTVNINSTDETSNQESRELREKRGQKYNIGEPLQDIPNPVPDILELPSNHTLPENALPVSESDLIIIGTVIESQAFLSSDKSNVYSEFTVKIEEQLKNNSPVELENKDNITVERVGGAIRFTSGKIQQRGVLGKGLPSKKNRYLLFLKWNEAGKDFLILTGYKFVNEKVTPLDGLSGRNISVYKNYKLYKNENESRFIQIVKDHINNLFQEEVNKW